MSESKRKIQDDISNLLQDCTAAELKKVRQYVDFMKDGRSLRKKKRFCPVITSGNTRRMP